MAMRWLWLRWSWRDLRRRWLMVAAIALIIAVGTGVYAGFSSMASWRRQSNDLNYARQQMYDLRVRLNPGSFADAGSLRALLDRLPDARQVARAEERLVMPMQVELSSPDAAPVHGELLGIDVANGGPYVNSLAVQAGRTLTSADDGRPVGVLHTGFARARGLPATGTLRVGGGSALDYVGLGLTPDYYIITARAAGYLPVGNLPNYAVLVTSLPTAQALAGQAGRVNDLVLTLAPDADVASMQRELQAALAASLPDVSATVTTRADDDGHRILYEDIDNDQRLVNVLAFLILGGAALAAFNLTSRLVEAQRREIGIGMALGVPPSRLVLRPLLFAAQVAVLGVLAGIPIGLLVGEAMKPILRDMLPLPIWQTPFQSGTFARAAALGFALPFLAAAVPILRLLRIEPVSAIRASYLSGRSGGLAPVLSRVPLPGRSIAQLPLRNLLRTPRRTLLTALAVGAAVTALVGTLGLVDTFNHVVDRGAAEATKDAPDRLDVQLDTFYPLDAAAVRAVATAPVTARADFGVRTEAVAQAHGKEIESVIDLIDFGTAPWTPTISRHADQPVSSGIVLAEKAAADLGVRPGDTITLRHPRREGLGFRMVETPVPVSGVHAGPLRFNAYMDLRQAGLFGLDGLTNLAQVIPAPGTTATAVQRALFGVAGVASVQPVSATQQQLKDVLGQFYDILRIAEAAALSIALLIGFNAMSIAADERAREHATMFAFGLPVRTVLRINVVESAIVGLVGTLLGLAGGFAVLSVMVRETVGRTIPELALQPALARSTIGIALVVGVVAIAIGPLFTIRRLQRMDIPATLRVVE